MPFKIKKISLPPCPEQSCHKAWVWVWLWNAVQNNNGLKRTLPRCPLLCKKQTPKDWQVQNPPFPPLSFRHMPFATNPWIGQWLGCIQVLALTLSSLHYCKQRPPSSKNLAFRFLQPLLISLLLWTLNHLPTTGCSLISWDVAGMHLTVNLAA